MSVSKLARVPISEITLANLHVERDHLESPYEPVVSQLPFLLDPSLAGKFLAGIWSWAPTGHLLPINAARSMKLEAYHPARLALLMLCLGCTPGKESRSTPGMVYVPGGVFLMGARSAQAYPDEYPSHRVRVSAFYIDETEVTNRQFMEFIAQTGYKTVSERNISKEEILQQLGEGIKIADSMLQPGSLLFRMTQGPVALSDLSSWWEWRRGLSWRDPQGDGQALESLLDHPVVHIAFEDAMEYACWSGKRLPTEAEWEWAAGGGMNYKYPWGNQDIKLATTKANFWQGFFPYRNTLEDGFLYTAPVKSFPPNLFGLYDMAGNVWEWCSDRYDPASYRLDSREGDPPNPLEPLNTPQHGGQPGDVYVTRGGSFLCNDSYCSGYRVSRRMPSESKSGTNHKGFRCAKSVPEGGDREGGRR